MLGRIRDFLNNLPRRAKSLVLAAFDAAALMGVLWLSYQLRLGGTFRPTDIHLLIMSFAPAIALPVFLRFGLYRAVIRYLPERAIWTILQAMAVATLLWVFVLFIAEATKFATCRAPSRSSTSCSAPWWSAARALPPSTCCGSPCAARCRRRR
jgi:hypothetical protein